MRTEGARDKTSNTVIRNDPEPQKKKEPLLVRDFVVFV